MMYAADEKGDKKAADAAKYAAYLKTQKMSQNISEKDSYGFEDVNEIITGGEKIPGSLKKEEREFLEVVLKNTSIPLQTRKRIENVLSQAGMKVTEADPELLENAKHMENKKGTVRETIDKSLDAVSDALAVASIIPGIDTFTDLASIPIDILREDWISAGLGAVGAIPILGEIADTAKLARKADDVVDAAKIADDVVQSTKNAKKVLNNTLPQNDGQVKHIFRNAEGHVLDTPENRKMLSDIANNESYYRGTDRYGNRWYVVNDEDGQQVWVRVRNGKIDNAGKNKIPKTWNDDTGLYSNAKLQNNDFKK